MRLLTDLQVSVGNFRKITRQQVVRSLWLGVIIGLLAGIAAVLFFEAIKLASEYLLTGISGYIPPEPLGEGNPNSSGPTRRWVLPLILGLGGLISGLIIYIFRTPEAAGAGAGAVIDDFHNRGGRVRWRVIPVKLLASAATLGGGGAAGREGPMAQLGGGIGSLIADRFHLGVEERRRALVAGMGAGIGAIFRAPLGGAMMAAESIYKHDFEADAVLLGLISSIVAFSVYGVWYDFEPIFGGTAGFSFSQPQELGYYAALGLACGLMGLLYIRGLDWVQKIFNRLSIPRWFKPMLGCAIAGLIGAAIPEAIGVGYGTIQNALVIDGVLRFSLWFLILIPFARILTTALTVGSGASGGIFASGMVSGGLLGALAWRLFNGLPGFPSEPGPLVIIGMISLFGSVAHAPLAMLLMVGEMTGNLSLLAPAMVAVALATLLVGNASVYPAQEMNREESTAHRHRFAVPLLGALFAQDAAYKIPIIEVTGGIKKARETLETSEKKYGVVVNSAGEIVGEITLTELDSQKEKMDEIDNYIKSIPVSVRADTPLDKVLETLSSSERLWVPVLTENGDDIIGAIDGAALVAFYKEAADQHVRPFAPLSDTENTFEAEIGFLSTLEGRKLAEANLPAGIRILTIERGGHVLVASGETILRVGDRLTISGPRSQSGMVIDLLSGK